MHEALSYLQRERDRVEPGGPRMRVLRSALFIPATTVLPTLKKKIDSIR